MPVEIRELIIRATTLPASPDAPDLPQAEDSADDREAIIEECVRQVLRILERREER